MKKQVLQLSVLALFFAVGCGADKSSSDACQYETTMNLDNGSYDAVLASGCADSMQKGAAYFGKAGYDVTTVINNFSSLGSDTAGSGPSDVNTYLTQLTGVVSGATLTNLSNAKTAYTDSITSMPEHASDAQFYVSIVDAVNSVSLIKAVVDSTGLGSIEMDCDLNGNEIPDELDASSYALTNGSVAISGVSSVPTFPLNLNDSVGAAVSGGPYQGMTITVGTLPDPNTTACTTNVYKKLLSTSFVVVTENVTAGICTNSSNISDEWPCPLFDANGQPMDLVSALEQSINSAIGAMSSALPDGGAEVQQAITDIKTEACEKDGNPACSSAELSNYLQSF